MRSVKRKMAALLAAVLMASGITASMPVAAAGNAADAGTDVSAGKSAAVQAELAAGADAVAQTDADTGADIHGEAKIPARTDETAGETYIPTASGQLDKKPEGTDAAGTPGAEALGVEKIVEALYAEVTEDSLAELVGRAGDAFAETEAPEGATDAEEYERMLSFIKKEVEDYLQGVLEKAKAEYAQLGQEEVYRAVFDGLCEKIMGAMKELYGLGDASVMSLLPLEEKKISVDLTGLTPIELTRIPFSRIFEGEDMAGLDKIAYVYHSSDYEWSDSYSDGYTVEDYSGYANLSYGTSYDSSYYSSPWLMIPGGDQMKGDAIRYIVNVRHTGARSWLVPTIYTQDAMGNRAEKTVSEYYYADTNSDGSRYLWIDVPADSAPYNRQDYYLKLDVNSSLYGEAADGMDIKVYEGRYVTADAAMAANDITDQILGNIDMGQQGAGYIFSGSKEITMVSFDAEGNVTGCLPLRIALSRIRTENYISTGSLFRRVEDSSREYVTYTTQSRTDADGMETKTCQLYEGYPANGRYWFTMDYYVNDSSLNSAVTAAYAGQYASIGEAESAGAADIKEKLFGNDYETEGYEADYSGEGVYFSVFVGEEGEGQEKYHYCIKAEESIVPKHSGVGVRFTGFLDRDGKRVDCYIVKPKDDSYAEGSYPIMIVGDDVDLTGLAPIFTTDTGVNLYAPGSSTPEKSGESYHDFSNGPIHYTTSAEDKNNAKNVWLTVKTEDNSETSYNLYTNSLSDEDANTRVENGVIYSRREVMLEAEDDAHDIILINMGENDIPKLSVELVSGVLELDEYWTLNGNHDLSAFAGVADETRYGELANMAKVRLKKKSEVVSGSEVEGTLTVKADGKVLMVLELTGSAGAPVITTKEIPEAVKYVPYGTMIQNSGKYRKTEVRYALDYGTLPEGMEIRRNGELYGVPKEEGTFRFTVRMVSTNPYANDTQSFELVVKENTDENVDASTDSGYDVTQRIPTVAIGSSGSRVFVSQGVFGEFADVFLDGEKLVKDVDYSAESGSTRLTISSQTLTRANEAGTHTLGVEFRTSDENLLKKAAQNFEVASAGTIIDDGNPGNDSPGDNGSEDGNLGNNGSGNDNPGSNDSGNGGSGSSNSGGGSTSGGNTEGNSSGSASANSSQFTANTIAAQGTAGAEAVRTVIYTVAPGDTLSAIAVRYYGNASLWRRIYEDNREVITNPNRVRAGMQIKLYLANVTAQTDETGNTTADTAGQYTIRGGDSLWKIARTMYGQGGQWRRIYEANRNVIPDSLILRVGQVITIP